MPTIPKGKGLKVNLGKTKVVVSGAGGEMPVSKVDPMWYLWKEGNGKFGVMHKMWKMDSW